MKILIYGLNYAPELTGIGKYTGEMASWLAKRGYQVRVVTAPPYYPAWRIADGYRAWRYTREKKDGVEVWRCPLWVPKSPTGKSRLVHLFSFALSSLPVMMLQTVWRPDVVMVIEPSLFCVPQGLLTSKLAKAKSWLHIQDFEVAAFFGLNFASSGLLEKACIAVERWLMRRFSMVSSISRAMVNRLLYLGVDVDKTYLFPNWVATGTFRLRKGDKDLRREWGIGADCKIVLYSGNMGQKQGLETVLEAAADLARFRSDVFFVMVGEGAAKNRLSAMAADLGLPNVVFKPLLPPEDLPDLLALADVHLVIQKRGAADAVLPSKLTGILAAGGFSLITADPDTELGRFVNDNPGIAVLTQPENSRALGRALVTILNAPSICELGGHLARIYAERNLDTEIVLAEMQSILVRLTGRAE